MEEIPQANAVEIKPLGSFLENDKDGFVINPASPEKIQEDYKPLIADTIELQKERFGGSLRNVYIRGSVAKGEAVPGVADFDTFTFVDLTQDEIKQRPEKDAKRELLAKYPFVTGIQLSVKPIADSQKRNNAIFLNQSLCVYGKPVEVPKLKPGREMAVHALSLHKQIDWLHKFLEKDETPEKLKKSCVRIMKELLRSGSEIVMERSGKYTRDLYPCYQIFSEYYPEKEPEMKEVLYLALNPTSDKTKIEQIINTLGNWLFEEAQKQLS